MEVTRSRILDVAQDLIQRRGLNAMSYQDFSESVGIRKASVHHHFPAKADLLKALLGRYRTQFDLMVEQIVGSKVSAPLKLKRYFGLFIETLRSGGQDKSCLCGMLAGELLSLDESSVEQVRVFFRENVQHVRRILAQGVEEGTLAAPGELTATAQMVLSTLEGAMLVARCEGGPKRMESMLDALRKLLEVKGKKHGSHE